MRLGLRVDVDTLIGLKEGVPRLLELFKGYSIPVSFFVTFGPDNSGKALSRLLQPGFLLKMWRTNPFRLYGVRTILSGTLLRPSLVGEGSPEILRSIVSEGHELGIHGYDHVRWQDHVDKMGEGEIENQLRKAIEAYENIFTLSPVGTAAPGWKSTPLSLAVQDRLKFSYASDTRGTSPFLPVHKGYCFHTLQLPTTLPTLDEILDRHSQVNDILLASLKEPFNVHTIHAEVEGRSYLSLFEDLLKKLSDLGVEFFRLRDMADLIYERGLEKIPKLALTQGKIPGRSGWVAYQGSPA